MTTKPVAYKTKLAGTLGHLEVDEGAEIGDEVAFVVVGAIKTNNHEGTDAGPVLTVGVKATAFHQLPTDLAEELILSIKRHGRARTLDLKGDRPLTDGAEDELDDADALLLGDSPADVVDRWLADDVGDALDDALDDLEEALDRHDAKAASDPSARAKTDDSDGDLELDDDDQDLDPAIDKVLAAEKAYAESLTPGDPMPRRPVDTGDDKAYVARLEAAWEYVDRASPGYADQAETERRARALDVATLSPWCVRNYLLLEIDELAGSEVFIAALEERHASELKRIGVEEPWEGFAKSTVDSIIGRLDSKKLSDAAGGNREATLEHVEVFELSHKGRKGVLGYIAEERLGHGPEADLEEPEALSTDVELEDENQ